jgi:trehalose-6-phosphatase
MNPEFKDEEPMNPFDFWSGANFKLKIRQVEGYANYDKSEFASPSPLFDGDDAKLEDVWKQQHSLQGLLAPENFKSYQELEARFKTVTASGTGSDYNETIEESSADPVANDAAESTSEDTLEYFKKLAEQ